METWIIDIMEKFGYTGILFLIAIENLFPPIPSEIILTFGGFMTTTSDLTLVGVIVCATIGSVIGAVILYGVGRFLDARKLSMFVERYGFILRLTPDDIHRADAWFQRHGAKAVFFCRFVPLIRSLISIPAGMSHLNFPLFLVLTTLGSLIWNAVLVYAGAAVGDSWETIVSYMDMYSHVMYAVIVVGFIGCVVWFIRTKKTKERIKRAS